MHFFIAEIFNRQEAAAAAAARILNTKDRLWEAEMGSFKNVGKRSKSETPKSQKWLKRREIWLVILGVILHAVYMLRSNEDAEVKKLLLKDSVVIFLHLLGCNSNGHAHRPYSSIYLNNVRVVGHIAERVYALLEDSYKDNSTAYIFTADHRMNDKGSHGDGHWPNTDNPLVVWGAGVKYPKPVSRNGQANHHFRFIDEHAHDLPTPVDWGLNDIERVDVNQADIAPLMAEEVEAVLANTRQFLNQFLRKSQIKQSHSLYFKPLKPLTQYSSMLDHIEHLISVGDCKTAMTLSQDLRSLFLQGLQYFQTYDWLMLMTVVTLGYVGWMIYIMLHVLVSCTSLAIVAYKREQPDACCTPANQS